MQLCVADEYSDGQTDRQTECSGYRNVPSDLPHSGSESPRNVAAVISNAVEVLTKCDGLISTSVYS